MSGSSIPEAKGEGQPDALTFDDYRDFARAHDSFTAPDAWASTHFERRDRDELVREWKDRRSPERVERARSAPTESGMTFHYAVTVVRSTAARGGGDALAVIEEMRGQGSLAPGVYEQLLARFRPAEAARAP